MLSRWIAAKAQQHAPASAPPLPQHYLLLGAAGLFTLGVAVGPLLSYGGGRRSGAGGDPWIPAPRRAAEAGPGGLLAYPPDALPGGRDVATPYGSVRVFEWGPEDGEPVLLLHGISTPAVALGDLAHDLVARGGHRVLLFDLWGRGWSDAPADLAYDARLYVSQVLLVLASSRADWARFHLVGYSFGGGLAVAFTRYFAHRVASLSLIATAGILRPAHIGLVNRFLYNSGVLPEGLVRWIVRRRLRPATKPEAVAEEAEADLLVAESKHAQRHSKKGSSKKEKKESAAKSSKSSTKAGGKDHLRGGGGGKAGGAGAGKGDASDPDSVPISRHRRDVTVAAVVAQQVDTHEGFVTAFLSSIRHAPIYAPQADWEALRDLLAERRRSPHRLPGLDGGRVLLVSGADDPVCVASEIVEDAQAALGASAVESVVLNAGHDLPITKSREVADALAHHISRAAGRGKRGLFG